MLLSSFSLSEEYIYVLQEKILSYKANTNEANTNFQKDMIAVLDTQKKEIEELIRKQQKEIEILKMDQERKTKAFEKKQQELQSMICNLKSEFSQSSQETVSQPIHFWGCTFVKHDTFSSILFFLSNILFGWYCNI